MRKRYPKYKDSGIEWLGEIPAHWEYGSLKYYLSCNDGGVWGDEFDDNGVMVLRSTEITADGKWKIEEPARRRLDRNETCRAVLREHDLLITKSSGSEEHIGKTAHVTKDIADLQACFSNFMQRIRPQATFSSKFLHYLLNSSIAREQYNYLSQTSTGLANLSGEIIGNVVVPIMPYEEQCTISSFMDLEIGRIETLMSLKGKQIELLKEKRAAVITRAVTKGLDPNAPMKDSGIEWLGEIPAHWQLLPIRRVMHRFVDYRGKTPEKVAAGIPLITAANVKNGFIDFANVQEYVEVDDYDEWMGRGLPEIGDVLITTEAPLGEVAQISDTSIALAQRIIMLKADKRLMVNEYLKYFIMSGAGNAELITRSTGSTALGIKAWHLKEILIAIPPLIEQRRIVTYIDHETANINKLVNQVQSSIEKLKEYRRALISAVVTGKIDVRSG